MSRKKITRKESPLRGIGKRIRQLRGARTQAAFAALLGMKQPQLARYEGGQQPDPATIVKIATTCGVTVDWLLTGVTLALPRARSDMDCQSALEAAIAGAPLKLRRIAGPKVDRAWSNMPTEQKDEIKDYLRRAALVAIAVERLLPPQAAKPVIDALSAQVTLAIIAKILK